MQVSWYWSNNSWLIWLIYKFGFGTNSLCSSERKSCKAPDPLRQWIDDEHLKSLWQYLGIGGQPKITKYSIVMWALICIVSI
jgi:hypothetical protein